MKAYNLFLSLLVLGTISCSTDNTLESNHHNEMSFSAGVGNFTSRVMNNQWEGDELIGVSVGTAPSYRTYNISTTGAMSTNEEPYEWEGTAVDVKAWTPLTDQPINLTDQTTEEKFYNCDLLACQTKAESANVQLAFNHQMTRMWYMIQNYGEYTPEEAQSAKVYFIGYGSATYTNGTITPQGNPDQLISTCPAGDLTGEALMVPCEMWEKPLIKVEIGGDTHIYTPSQGVESDVARATGVLAAGVKQMYYLQITKKELSVVSNAIINDWSSENADKGAINTEVQ